MLPFTTLSGATSAGVGVARDLEGTFGTHHCEVFYTGAPSSIAVDLEGSHDGANWFRLVTLSGVTTGRMRGVSTSLLARFVRANITDLTGGSSPTVTATIASAA